jgi:hypothetical protein
MNSSCPPINTCQSEGEDRVDPFTLTSKPFFFKEVSAANRSTRIVESEGRRNRMPSVTARPGELATAARGPQTIRSTMSTRNAVGVHKRIHKRVIDTSGMGSRSDSVTEAANAAVAG